MAKLNENYLNIKQSYLFSEIAKRINDYCKANPDKADKVIRLGIGDVTLPLGSLVIKALHGAVDEMGSAKTFRGYGPEQGYDFLRNGIKDYYARNGVELDADEIFVSDGAKSDTGNFTDMFSIDNTVLVPDPVYPVYVDTNIMNGRNIIYMDGTAENGFLPMPNDDVKADIIYLCSPNNPTGAVYNKRQLKAWVDYANKNDAIILFDSAYEAFVSQPDLPRSIFSIEGAKTCAVEFCSLSKTAGFTGTRCGYTVVPKAIIKKTADGRELSLNNMWNRRQTTKFNGVPYITQRGAEAVFTKEGMEEAKAMINVYRKNAALISQTMTDLGVNFTGGINSPYIWFECPFNMYSWDFFDKMLTEIQVVGTPGAGFGKNGDNFFRLTSFNNYENTKEAMNRFKTLFN